MYVRKTRIRFRSCFQRPFASCSLHISRRCKSVVDGLILGAHSIILHQILVLYEYVDRLHQAESKEDDTRHAGLVSVYPLFPKISPPRGAPPRLVCVSVEAAKSRNLLYGSCSPHQTARCCAPSHFLACWSPLGFVQA